MKNRLKVFAVRVIKLVDKLPNTPAGRAIGNQVVRSGTSPGANYRAACIGKSDKDFLNKLKMVEEELDETAYWLELIMELELVKPELLQDLHHENTPDGINLYEPLTVNGITFQHLVYDDATGAIKATDADVSFPYPTALEQFCGTTSQWYLSFDIAAGTGDMDKELMDLFSNAYAINKSTQYEEFIGWYIGANSAYPGNDTNPYCMGWESNWLGLQVWDVAYGYKMSIIDEASKKISLQSTAPGINYDFYVFLDPIIEYVDAHSPYTVEFDDDQTPTTAKLVSTVDNKVWFSLTKQ